MAHRCPCTVWTTIALAPATYRGFPFMASSAYPPDLLSAAWSDVPWCQTAVLCGMPFCREVWIQGLKAIVLAYGFPCTVWTTTALAPVVYAGFPLMAFATYPPDLPRAARSDVPWCQTAVLPGMPFSGQVRVDALQILVCHTLHSLPLHHAGRAVRPLYSPSSTIPRSPGVSLPGHTYGCYG